MYNGICIQHITGSLIEDIIEAEKVNQDNEKKKNTQYTKYSNIVFSPKGEIVECCEHKLKTFPYLYQFRDGKIRYYCEQCETILLKGVFIRNFFMKKDSTVYKVPEFKEILNTIKTENTL